MAGGGHRIFNFGQDTFAIWRKLKQLKDALQRYIGFAERNASHIRAGQAALFDGR